jgi:hypothetical protein
VQATATLAPARKSFIFVLREKNFCPLAREEQEVLPSEARDIGDMVSTPPFLKDREEKKTKAQEEKHSTRKTDRSLR